MLHVRLSVTLSLITDEATDAEVLIPNQISTGATTCHRSLACDMFPVGVRRLCNSPLLRAGDWGITFAMSGGPGRAAGCRGRPADQRCGDDASNEADTAQPPSPWPLRASCSAWSTTHPQHAHTCTPQTRPLVSAGDWTAPDGTLVYARRRRVKCLQQLKWVRVDQ